MEVCVLQVIGFNGGAAGVRPQFDKMWSREGGVQLNYDLIMKDWYRGQVTDKAFRK
jgi:hypothetical protein